MPFSFSGVSLDQNGWVVEADSNPWGALERGFDSLRVPGRDGGVSVLASVEAPALPLTIFTPRDHLEALLSLFSAGTGVLGDGLRELAVDVLSVVPSRVGDPTRNARVNVVLRATDVFWRSAEEHVYSPVALDSASVAVQLFPGLSAPVRDAVVRVRGQVNGLRVSDSRGTFFEYTADLLGTEYLLFDAATGKAFKATTDTWVMNPANEVTSLVTNGPGPYYLELTPSFTDPSSRLAVLTVTSSARSGSPTVEVRGKNAFLV